MVGKLFNTDNSIIFKEDTHQYFNKIGEELSSVSRVIGKVKTPFDREKISCIIGTKYAKEHNITVKEGQAIILQQWEYKKNSAIDRGNWIHDNLEQYLLTGLCDPKLNGVVEQLKPIIKNNHRIYPEALIYNTKYMVAGQSDLCIQRQKNKQPVIDFFDYKTNEALGIQYDSIKIKDDGEIKHYNRYMLSPFNHLEDCNFIHYSLQLSLYAFMSEDTWGIRVGKLAILFVDLDLKIHIIPVPYMKLEAKALLDYNTSLKPLPQVIQKPMIVKESFTKQEIFDNKDW